MRNSKKWLAIGLVTVVAVGMTGCKKPQTAPTDETDGGAVTTIETNTQGETAVDETTNPYANIIVKYQEKIGYVAEPQAAKPDQEQQASVDAMEMLNKSNASSKEIFTLFKADIEGLRGAQADAFAAAALSGLRRNSFNDYSQTEPYFSDMANLQKFFDAAEPFAFNYYDLKKSADQVKDPELKKMFDKMAEQGYMLASAEGMVFPIVDYCEIAKYKKNYTPAFAAVMDQLAYGNVEIIMSDGGIRTTLDHIVARVFEAENQLKTLEEGPYQKYLAMEYIENLRLLFFGSDNSPAYDYETGKLREEVALLYKKMASYEGSKTATYVQMHMEILEASQGKYDEATNDKIRSLFTKIQSDFKIGESEQNGYYDWLSGK